ncbi:MAG TPA: hypothetical protein VL728_08425 [Cyclobacteriaceae bacterium]|jgi:hypothetical protein|nr:hypothetical protein [Cyclobacteriaceae bacterium]
MKKMVVLAWSILLLANTYSLAKRATRGEFHMRSSFHQKEDRVKIKKEELPEAARKTLQGDVFKGWAVVNSYRTKAGEYEIELKKGDNVQSMKFDKDGKLK